MTSSDRLAYNRLETDIEFRARIVQTRGLHLFTVGRELDDDAWRYARMQRRIVFVPVD